NRGRPQGAPRNPQKTGLPQGARMKSGSLSRCPFGAGRDKLAAAMGGPEIPPGAVPSDLPQDVAKRLLDAWRGEIEARAVYEALAAREKDERRSAVLRKM